jgi:hypothetical protein
MKWACYALALVIGLVALVSGIASGKGVIAGAGAGWLIDSVILIVKRQSATVTASAEPDLSLFAIFDNLPAWLWGVSVAILVVGALVGYFIKH